MRGELAVGPGRGPRSAFLPWHLRGARVVVGPRRQGAVTEEAAGWFCFWLAVAGGWLAFTCSVGLYLWYSTTVIILPPRMVRISVFKIQPNILL